MKYRKRPVVIEALQLRWDNWEAMREFAGVGKISDRQPERGWVDPQGTFRSDSPELLEDGDIPGSLALAIPTLEGLMVATEGDWVIRGIAGELYPCKPNIFEATYEALEAME